MSKHELMARIALSVAYAEQKIIKGWKMKKDKMEKCKTCANLDREKTNDNWTVCPKIPVNVLCGDSAEKCANYIHFDDPLESDIDQATRLG